MRILTEDRIDFISGGYLSEYLSDPRRHGVDLMRNEHPSIQWIAGLPTFVEEDSATGERFLSYSFYTSGYPSFNGIYLGNFSADKISITISKNDNGTITKLGTAVVPTKVFKSFGHFVRGVQDINNDYLYSLKDLGFSDEYLTTGFTMDVNMTVNTSFLKKNVSIKVNKATALSYVHPDTSERYLKIKGNLIANGETISASDARSFGYQVNVGSYFVANEEQVNGTNFNPVFSNGDRVYRPIQVVEIVGNGTKENALTFVMRERESVNSMLSGDPEFINVGSEPFTTYDKEIEITQDSYFLCTEAFRSMRLGILRAGYLEEFPNPQTGLTRAYKDNSVSQDLVNGAHNFSNRKIGRIYSGTLMLNRDKSRKLLAFVEEQRAKPFPVEILTGMEEETPSTFYGYLNNTPSERFSQRTGAIRDLDFSIQQVF